MTVVGGCSEGGESLIEPEATADSVFAAAGQYTLLSDALMFEFGCRDLYDRAGDGELWMGAFQAQLKAGGDLHITYRTDEYCFYQGSLSSGVNAWGNARGSWETVGVDSLDITLSNGIEGFLVPRVRFLGVDQWSEPDTVWFVPDTFAITLAREEGEFELKVPRGG